MLGPYSSEGIVGMCMPFFKTQRKESIDDGFIFPRNDFGMPSGWDFLQGTSPQLSALTRKIPGRASEKSDPAWSRWTSRTGGRDPSPSPRSFYKTSVQIHLIWSPREKECGACPPGTHGQIRKAIEPVLAAQKISLLSSVFRECYCIHCFCFSNGSWLFVNYLGPGLATFLISNETEREKSRSMQERESDRLRDRFPGRRDSLGLMILIFFIYFYHLF